MEDYKFLIYIALSILYFIFKNIGGKKDKPLTRRKTNSGSGTDTPSDNRPKTFQEILEELSGEKFQQQETPQEIYEEASSSRGIEQAAPRPLNQTVDADVYENADETLKELYKKGEKLKTINELVDIDEVETKSRFAAYQQNNNENQLASEIREGLQDPETAKKAFIYSEIFIRKY